MAGNNGSGTETNETTYWERVTQPLFENELLAPGSELHEAITKSYFDDEQRVNNTCRYIRRLLKYNKNGKMKIAINAALMKINGNRAIKARSTKYSVQAHGGLFWDSDASEKDKKYLANLQERKRDNQNPIQNQQQERRA